MSFELFMSINEPYAAGFFEFPDKSRFFRFANAHKRFWENVPAPAYTGGRLYPAGAKCLSDCAVMPEPSYTFWINPEALKAKSEQALELMADAWQGIRMISPPHTVGGNGFTHSFPNYQRIVKEGLNSYQQRVTKLPEGDFKEGLLAVLDGIHCYHGRCLALLREADAEKELINALEQVPFDPARNLYEALVCWNFIYYIDGCDDPGAVDMPLYEYYKGEDVTDLLEEFYNNVDANSGWSATLGPECNELTRQCLIAIRGKRRPSMEFRVNESTPQWAWEEAAQALMSGCGQPAFYNEELYQAKLHEKFPYIPKEDLMRFNGGGCTETMLAGISNVGSLDAGINLAYIFSGCMRAELYNADSFEEFYSILMDAIKKDILNTLDEINIYQQDREIYRPNPLRTLLIDDCIDNQSDFNSKGARYYWSVVNVAGLINVIDSLLAIRKWVYENPKYKPADFIAKLDAQDPEYLSDMKNSPCYGVDDKLADSLAARFAADVFSIFDLKKPYLGGAFLPASIQFITYAGAGWEIPATPDGRAAGEPLCDSVGAVHGKDINGPTALLNSVAAVPFSMALGTPVLNLRLQKEHLEYGLKPLIMGFFEQGGMQVQISCLSREDMLDALENPHKHENLIVRIGGYSEYFNRLSDELKRAVIKRTEHSLG